MRKFAVLGPTGSFSDMAAKKFMIATNQKLNVEYFSNISRVFNAIGRECELGIIPIENTLDGYVQLSLDLLLNSDLKIIKEVTIPIQFSFISNTPDIKKLSKVYAQFKTQGQCINFLNQFKDSQIVTTESNSTSFNLINNQKTHDEGAIIPQHLLNVYDFPFVIENVTDSCENETRFIIISKNPTDYNSNKKYKTSLAIITRDGDEPGLLAKILNQFSENGINLTSIMSRPTKKLMGKYHFFIDIEGHYIYNSLINKTVNKIEKEFMVKILGAYTSI